MNTADAIIAVASPPGRAARGIVRLSGTGLEQLVPLVLWTCDHQPMNISRGCRPARFRLTESISLPVLTLMTPGPRSYTGEDTIELQAPGNPPLLERIIARWIEMSEHAGVHVRRAEGGEFTARAFFNGRLGLTEAEGVAATIAARSDAELRAAGMLRTGTLGRLAHELADDLAAALALVEAGIDFTDEEDVVAIAPADLYDRLIELRGTIHQSLDRSVGMEQLEAIPWVVLTGPTNAGKSTLFNALLGHERAVVSEVAGTTRDVLIEPMSLDIENRQCEVLLVDLAGADTDPSAINRQMQLAADDARARADLVLHCAPSEEAVPRQRSANMLILRTKHDLDRDRNVKRAPVRSAFDLEVSAQTGHGLDDLRQQIAERLADRAVTLSGDLLALQPRHEAALRSAASNLDEAIALVEPFRLERSLSEPELVAASMRASLNELGELAGDITPDDVLGRIFSTFCVGK